KSGRGLLLLFDFDGTLVDIAPTPDKVNPSPDLKLLFRQLVERDFTNVAILSGRSLMELQEYIPSSISLAFAGCHGCELQMPGEVEQSILDDEEIQRDLDDFASGLEELSDWPGIIVEHKGCAVAIHYRLADKTTIEHTKEEFYNRAEALPNYEEMEIIEGKAVLELRPTGMNKGIAVQFMVENFLTSEDSLTVYFGDDITDLDGFEALPENSLRVAVGNKIAEYADYMLDSPSRLLELIRQFLE
ncbi:trehalose-phosphatase, partial [candidate division WOR-3 bacterium]|nr:trehalose-phosphatase [candidate division WOR-3 bacterium]MBD3364457.1 trehalose-phosphatase [candidate division WOR-3 bacterium]